MHYISSGHHPKPQFQKTSWGRGACVQILFISMPVTFLAWRLLISIQASLPPLINDPWKMPTWRMPPVKEGSLVLFGQMHKKIYSSIKVQFIQHIRLLFFSQNPRESNQIIAAKSPKLSHTSSFLTFFSKTAISQELNREAFLVASYQDSLLSIVFCSYYLFT